MKSGARGGNQEALMAIMRALQAGRWQHPGVTRTLHMLPCRDSSSLSLQNLTLLLWRGQIRTRDNCGGDNYGALAQYTCWFAHSLPIFAHALSCFISLSCHLCQKSNSTASQIHDV